MQTKTRHHCPCGNSNLFSNCCGQYIENDAATATAEELMRSRYSAYTLNNSDYLLKTWHSPTRPTQLDLEQQIHTDWLGLKIYHTEAGSENETTGIVAFIARYTTDETTEVIHEVSRFVKEDGHWFYVDGTLSQPTQNSLCPCGSAKKFKRCCGT